MGDLFGDAAAEQAARTGPLAHRVRPRSLDELVGQQEVVGPGTALGRAIAEGRAPSMILHGPPGVGKTTIARIVAETSSAAFEELSAVSARIDDVRAVIARARDRLGGNGVRTLLFIDEIHRFDKRQQDSVLHAVEDGLVTLIGATTENPYFEVNQALLSRCTVIELEPLSLAELERVVSRGAEELGADVPADIADEIARRSGGDARTALQTLELAWETASTAGVPLAVEHVEDAARKRPLRYDRDGDRHYDLTSAFIKAMRGSDPDAAVYYLAAMLEGGEDPRFLARRMVIAASEDVGDADPRALLVAVAAAHALEHVGLPEAQLNLAQAAIYLARAPKSNAVARAIWQAREDVRREGIQPPPPALRDAHYRGAAARGHGTGYVSPHDDPAGAVEDHLPEGLRGRTYYRPSSPSEEPEEATRDDRDGRQGP
jgi:putative ATPase